MLTPPSIAYFGISPYLPTLLSHASSFSSGERTARGRGLIAAERRSGSVAEGDGRRKRRYDDVDEEYRFRGGGIDDLDEDDLKAVESLLSLRGEARRARNYGAADAIRDEMFRKFSVLVDDKKRTWYLDRSAALERPERKRRTKSTAGTKQNGASRAKDDAGGGIPWTDEGSKSIPWGEEDEEDQSNPRSFDDILDESTTEFQVAASYEKSSSSLDMDEKEEDYIMGRINKRIEASADGDYDTMTAIQTELLLCYDVHLDDVRGMWSKGGEFGKVDDTKAVTDLSRSEDVERLGELTITELKQKLREKGLPVSGRKSELIQRLLSWEQ